MVELADGAVEEASSDDGDRREPPPANQVVAPPPANQGVVPPPNPVASSGSTSRQAQLAQLTELQKKLEEEHRQTRLLQTTLEQERAVRGASAQAAGRVARERILANDNVSKLLELKRAKPCRSPLRLRNATCAMK